jgi:hypothetical protein
MTWNKIIPNSASWNQQNLSSGVFSKQVPSSASWDNAISWGYLLMENGYFLLQDDGKIRLNLLTDLTWGQQNPNMGSWTQQIPN